VWVRHTTDLLRLERGGPSYPPQLENIDGPPERLWVRGRLELISRPRRRLALVGTRAPTPYGVGQAQRFGRALGRAGVVVVSGLAQGIDQTAHASALEVGGDTLAVLGSGLNRPWPRVPLVDEIAQRGLLVSEFEPEQGPRPHHFPLRNRIISGLVDGLLVIEAAGASGSLITARWAADQGRDVFALPGRVDQPMAAGCHRILREGAGLVESPEELLRQVYGDGKPWAPQPPEVPQSELESLLQGETLGPDELAQRLDQKVEQVLVELVRLELDGKVVRAPGGLYRLG
jgi:DNA processing protein